MAQSSKLSSLQFAANPMAACARRPGVGTEHSLLKRASWLAGSTD